MKRKLTALLLVLGLLCTFVTPVMAYDTWWTQYVTNPMSDYSITNTGTVESEGKYILFTSDVHRYAYLAKDLLDTANAAIPGTDSVGLFAFGGDFANEYVLYEDNMSIVKAAIGDTPATYTKGNHEGSVADDDFVALTGMSRIGETAKNKDGLYHFYNFGAYDKNQQFLEEDIATLKTWLETISDNKPIFIVSHYPLHYYNDRRSSTNADKVLELLNGYPQVTFLWGHNHTEQDPNYGMIRTPGDIIQTGATADTSKEIKFTYACLGACRDGWNRANGLLAEVNGTQVTFQYIGLDNTISSENWTDAQGNENAIRVPGSTAGVSSNTNVETAADYATITLANLQIDRPLVDGTPATEAKEYSPRFSASAVTWSTASGPHSGVFDFDTQYTATVTLTPEAGYTFASGVTVSVNKEYVGPMPGQKNHEATVTVNGDGTATVTYTFDKTVAQGTPVAAATTLEEGASYVLATIDGSNVAAYYQYDESQHGEESKAEYTAAAADVVVRSGQLYSAVDNYTVFTAQKDVTGYLLWSAESYKVYAGKTDADAVNFLTMSTRGGDLGLEAAVSAGNTIYNNWNLDENGVPYLDVDGATKYLTFTNGAFGYADYATDSNVRLFQVGTATDVYSIPVTVTAPVAGQTPSGEAKTPVGTATATWDAESFGYGTEYTVTVTVTPNVTVPKALVARVNGNNATVQVQGSNLVVTYTFPATANAPGAKTALTNQKADAIAAGQGYIITVGDKAMTIHPDGVYQASTSITVQDGKITSDVTADMVFHLEGNATDGYTLKNGNNYLAGRSVDDSPDVWGFTTTTDATKAVTFNYVEGKLVVVSTGASAGPGGPPPGGNSADSYLYENNGHFNFSAYNFSPITLYHVALPFQDVANDWSRDYIYNAALWGLMLGVETDKFGPEETMTRAMAVAVLYRMDGSPAVTGSTKFTDLKNDYYVDAVVWANQNKIVVGTTNTTFSPNQEVTREMFAAMVARYLEYKGITVEGTAKTFTDIAKAESYAKPYIETCSKGGIINGDDVGTFRPKDEIARKEAATMLVNLHNFLTK